jgi:hypothetical protein
MGGRLQGDALGVLCLGRLTAPAAQFLAVSASDSSAYCRTQTSAIGAMRIRIERIVKRKISVRCAGGKRVGVGSTPGRSRDQDPGAARLVGTGSTPLHMQKQRQRQKRGREVEGRGG